MQQGSGLVHATLENEASLMADHGQPNYWFQQEDITNQAQASTNGEGASPEKSSMASNNRTMRLTRRMYPREVMVLAGKNIRISQQNYGRQQMAIVTIPGRLIFNIAHLIDTLIPVTGQFTTPAH